MKFNYSNYKEDRDIVPAPLMARENPNKDDPDGLILENVDSAGELASAQMRSMAMNVVLAWVNGEDFSYLAFDEFMVGMADLDGDDELTDEEIAVYEDLWQMAADAMLSLGADADNVEEFLDGEDDTAGEKLGGFLSGIMDKMPSSDSEITTSFATGVDGAVFECAGGLEGIEDTILEAAYKKTKVVRGGKVVIKKKRISGKVRLSSAQRAGLKKARRKSNTSAAKLHRAKSARVRKKRGM